MRLIDADALKTELEKMIAARRDWDFDSLLVQREIQGLNDALHKVNSAPTIDAEPVKAIEQFKWERDVAIEQLNEIGKGLGSRMDDVATVVRCKDCKWLRKPYCDKHYCCYPKSDDWFCADGERRTEVEE